MELKTSQKFMETIFVTVWISFGFRNLAFLVLFNFRFVELEIFSGLNPKTIVWVSNLRFTSCFNLIMNLFLSNCWLSVFVFLQSSAVKTQVLNFFLSSLAQQSRSGVSNFILFVFQNLNFQFPVSNTNWIWNPLQKIPF